MPQSTGRTEKLQFEPVQLLTGKTIVPRTVVLCRIVGF